MYSPPYNRVEDRRELVDFMRANSFPLLITATDGVPQASHLPVTVEDGEGGLLIQSHMAKPNPQWQAFFDDEVLVAFEHGDIGRAYVVGALWSRSSPPPASNADVKVIRSRSGHALTFDDSREGRVQVALNDGRSVTLDTAGISVEDGKGNRVTIESASGAITIQAAGSLALRAPAITIDASSTLDLKTSGPLTIKGAVVRLN